MPHIREADYFQIIDLPDRTKVRIPTNIPIYSMETVGWFGMKRDKFLKENEPHTRNLLFAQNKLVEHLKSVNDQAEKRYDTLMEQMAKAEGVTEELKAKNQMLWVGLMNNLDQAAKESIFREIICV